MMLLLMSFTNISSQTTKDTSKTLYRYELQRIADKFAKGIECDSLLDISQNEISNLNNILSNDSLQMQYYIGISSKKEFIIQGKDIQIEDLNYSIKQNTKKLYWVESGWIATSLLLISLLIIK